MHERTHLAPVREDQGGTRGYLRSFKEAEDESREVLRHHPFRRKTQVVPFSSYSSDISKEVWRRAKYLEILKLFVLNNFE